MIDVNDIYDDDCCKISGPDENGVFCIETGFFGESNHTFIDNKMLDFMIEHRIKKENG